MYRYNKDNSWNKAAKEFLLEMSKYWEKKAISTKEDKEFHAYCQNSQNCLNIMEMLKDE